MFARNPIQAPPGTARQVGRFRLIRPLDYGGAGETFEAFDSLFGETIALKLLPRQAGGEADLCRRAWQWASIRHENVVAVRDAGHVDERIFIAMERLDARPLALRLSAEPLGPAKTALPILEQVLSAVQAAHRGCVVHGALQPGNILCSDGDVVRVSDFGLPDELTDGFLRPPYYQSPEQLSGETIDYRTDIYAAGVIAYELFTGATPFVSTPPAVSTAMIKIMSGQRLPLFGRVMHEHPALDGVLARAMARNPAHRFQSALEFSAELNSALAQRM